MKEITKQQIITIHTLLRNKGLSEEKPRIVSEASGMRTIRCSQLYYNEAQNLINMLNGKREDQLADKSQRMRKHIIAMAHEIGFIKKQQAVMREGGMKEINNYDDLHSWILKYGYLHKPMDKYKYAELPTLVTQFKQVYASKMKLK